MSNYGNIILRGAARITGLSEPISDNEPGLAKNSVLFPIKGGRQFSQQVNATPTTTVTVTANVCRFSVLEIRSSCIISAYANEVTTLVAGALYRTCIYKVDDLLYPTTLVADGGVDQSAATNGIRSSFYSSNVTLRAGIYLVGLKSSLAPALRAADPRGLSSALGITGVSAISGFTVPLPWVANTPFPATFPSLAVGNLVASAQPLHIFTSV